MAVSRSHIFFINVDYVLRHWTRIQHLYGAVCIWDSLACQCDRTGFAQCVALRHADDGFVFGAERNSEPVSVAYLDANVFLGSNAVLEIHLRPNRNPRVPD